MAIGSISNQGITQTAEAQRSNAADTAANRHKMAPARAEHAYSVNISEEAQKKAQEEAQETRQNEKVAQTERKPQRK
jgi:hypothetical protein